MDLKSDRLQFKEKKDKLRAITLGELKREDYHKEDSLYNHENRKTNQGIKNGINGDAKTCR